MSKRPNLVLNISELSSDEEDDELLNDTTSVFKKTPTAASLKTPKQEEYLTPLGTSTLSMMFGEHGSIGQDVTLALEEKGFVSIGTLIPPRSTPHAGSLYHIISCIIRSQ